MGLAAKMVKRNHIRDAWVGGAKPLTKFASDVAFVWERVSQPKWSIVPLSGMLGLEVQIILQSLHLMGPLCSQGGRQQVRKPIDSSGRVFFVLRPLIRDAWVQGQYF